VLVKSSGLRGSFAAACALALLSAIAVTSASAQEAEPAPALAPPAATYEACAAARCLGVSLTPELAAALASAEPVSPESLAQGLSFSHKGEPLDVRLIVARYDNNRLVRYGVSERTPFGGEGGLAVSDAGAVTAKALKPVTTSTVEVKAFEGAGAPVPIMIQSFVGAVPPTYLVGEPGKSLLPADAPLAEQARGGSVGLLVLEPEAAELRDGAAAHSYGALVRLELKRP
jgi:hypothetical protein